MAKLPQAAADAEHFIVVREPASHCKPREYFRHPTLKQANTEAERLALKFRASFAVYMLASRFEYEETAS